MAVIGVDIGSQSVKAVRLDGTGEVLAVGTAPLTMAAPANGWAEQEPDHWIEAFTLAVRAVADPGVSTLAIAAQVDGVVPVDAALTALRPGIIWLDRRGTRELDAFVARLGADTVFERTGLNADASHSAPKMMWLRDTEPDVWRRTRWLLPVAGHLLGWLTGEVAQDPANASSTMLLDIATGAYADDLCAAAGIDPALLPPVRPATEVVGTLTARVAERLGLPPGCRVTVGTGDEHGACLAAGSVDPGVVVDVAGTAEAVGAASVEPLLDATRLVETHRHAAPDTYLVENPGFVAGGSTLWLATQVLGVPQGEVFALAERAPAASDGLVFVPALSGSTTPRWNSDLRASFSGLSMTHSQAHLSRAVLEGCAYGLRDIVDRLAAMGLADGEVRIVGGGGNSPLWNQIKADVLGRPVRRVRTEHATAVGAAMLAAVAAGEFADLTEAAKACVEVDPGLIEPDAARQQRYADGYAAYQRLFDGLEGALR